VSSDVASCSVSIRSAARDLRALCQLPGPVGHQREVHRAEQGLHPDVGAGVGAEVDVTLHGELHPDVVAVQVDRLHLAHPDPGDADLVVGLEPAGLRERGVVGVPAADQRQVLGTERGEHQREEDDKADRADHDGIPLPERCAHPRSHLADPVS
jgi:hypothetical protein